MGGYDNETAQFKQYNYYTAAKKSQNRQKNHTPHNSSKPSAKKVTTVKNPGGFT
jgi:hypothetical protein